MKLYFHYCSFGFSNSYILGTDFSGDETGTDTAGKPTTRETSLAEAPLSKTPPREAVIIDPGNMDEQMLDFLESNEYTLKGVLITHDHINHVHGLRTLERIYKTDIYAINHIILDQRTNLVKDGDVINAGSFSINVISVPGHSSDSAVFMADHLLFTGDALTAGLVGRTSSTYGAAIQMNALRSRILSLPGNYMVLPGHGPPSTLEAEREFNAGIDQYNRRQTERPVFRVDI
jgi:glyoxylase-like metal-dependent hydrolase (beta-lactamase superfamily II)